MTPTRTSTPTLIPPPTPTNSPTPSPFAQHLEVINSKLAAVWCDTGNHNRELVQSVSLSGAGVYDEISSNITMWDWGALSAGVNNLRVYGNRLLRVWTYHFPDDVYGYTQKFSPFARDVYGIYTLANFDLSATGMYYDEWKERLNDGLLEASLGGEGQDDVMIMLTLFSKHDLQDDFTRSPWKASNNDTGASGVAVINSDSGFPYVYNIRLDMTPTTQTPTATPA